MNNIQKGIHTTVGGNWREEITTVYTQLIKVLCSSYLVLMNGCSGLDMEWLKGTMSDLSSF
jgi:hypothetical protein